MVVLQVLLVIFATVYDRMWKRLLFNHPAVYRDPQIEMFSNPLSDAYGLGVR